MNRVVIALALAVLAAAVSLFAVCDQRRFDQIKAAGERAERLGLVPQDNPYTLDSDRCQWLSGFMDQRERRMKDAGLCEP